MTIGEYNCLNIRDDHNPKIFNIGSVAQKKEREQVRMFLMAYYNIFSRG